ncbi:MAG: response regulator [Burkholderiales bacterium]
MTSADRAVPLQPGKVARVLVVDDDEVMRTVLRRMFLDAGLRVETYASAKELLDTANLSRPGVLLLDVQLPGMSGIELQALLRVRGVDLPVLFLTGGSDISKAVQAMRNGALDFLEKPFSAAVLIHRVGQAFAQSVRTSEVDAPAASSVDYARRLATLTPREREVHGRIVAGMTSKSIAVELGGSFRTVEIHRTRVMAKMAVSHLAGLVRLAVDAEAIDRAAALVKRDALDSGT